MNAEELRLETKRAFGQVRLEVHDGLLERKQSGDGSRGTGRYVSEILIDGDGILLAAVSNKLRNGVC
jgi:hypothetical protein